MNTDETLYIRILVWAYQKQEAGFTWAELVKEFSLTNEQNEWAEKVFRSNMPQTDNLIDYLSYSSRNQGRCVITAKGTAAAIDYLNLQEAKNSGKRAERIALSAIAIGVVVGIAGIIVQICFR